MAPWNGPNKEKNIGKIYSASGKFAKRAKLAALLLALKAFYSYLINTEFAIV